MGRPTLHAAGHLIFDFKAQIHIIVQMIAGRVQLEVCTLLLKHTHLYVYTHVFKVFIVLGRRQLQPNKQKKAAETQPKTSRSSLSWNEIGRLALRDTRFKANYGFWGGQYRHKYIHTYIYTWTAQTDMTCTKYTPKEAHMQTQIFRMHWCMRAHSCTYLSAKMRTQWYHFFRICKLRDGVLGRVADAALLLEEGGVLGWGWGNFPTDKATFVTYCDTYLCTHCF